MSASLHWCRAGGHSRPGSWCCWTTGSRCITTTRFEDACEAGRFADRRRDPGGPVGAPCSPPSGGHPSLPVAADTAVPGRAGRGAGGTPATSWASMGWSGSPSGPGRCRRRHPDLPDRPGGARGPGRDDGAPLTYASIMIGLVRAAAGPVGDSGFQVIAARTPPSSRNCGTGSGREADHRRALLRRVCSRLGAARAGQDLRRAAVRGCWWPARRWAPSDRPAAGTASTWTVAPVSGGGHARVRGLHGPVFRRRVRRVRGAGRAAGRGGAQRRRCSG